MNLYHVTVPYGRGEMTGRYLVGARSPLKAKRLGNDAAPCHAPLHQVKCRKIEGVKYTGNEPAVVERL
jgi:hypothetical protein